MVENRHGLSSLVDRPIAKYHTNLQSIQNLKQILPYNSIVATGGAS
ncbi:hypothetical protein K4039_19385 [Lyngbya sp. CCAP 1446/10]|nr:hypothetical protein [Lyngbya sp. CCAP 1446/10]MCW6052193.1 hypothetical protein [Lyngbya sp. CCAP 1446/10]